VPDIFDKIDSTSSPSKGSGRATPTGDIFDRLTGPEPTKSDEKPYKAQGEPIDYKALRKAALPVAGGVGFGLATGGMGFLPAVGMAALGGAAGEATEQITERVRGESDAPQTSTDAAKRIGIAGAEQGGAEAGGRVVSGALSKVLGKLFSPETSSRLYQSALKPTGTNEAKALGTVRIGIKEKIPLGEKAADVVRGRINQLNDTVERTIQNSPANISPRQYVNNVEQKLNVLRSRWQQDPTHGREFVAQIDEMERQFLLQHGNPKAMLQRTQKGMVVIHPEDMTLRELRLAVDPISTGDAQAIKKQAYETIRTARSTAWDPGQHPGLNIRVQKEISKALKEELENVYPQIKSLNAREGALIGLEDQLQRFAKREMNRQVTSMTLFGAGGYAIGEHTVPGGGGPGVMAGLIVRRMLENPAIKSRLAIALDAASKSKSLSIVKTATRQIPKNVLKSGSGIVEYNREKKEGQTDQTGQTDVK